jgi:hypothetical protein
VLSFNYLNLIPFNSLNILIIAALKYLLAHSIICTPLNAAPVVDGSGFLFLCVSCFCCKVDLLENLQLHVPLLHMMVVLIVAWFTIGLLTFLN